MLSVQDKLDSEDTLCWENRIESQKGKRVLAKE